MSNREDMLWRNLDWNLLRTFYEIAHHGGVSAAAASLGRQQPAVSHALRRLEEALGVQLCKRGPAGFTLTREGAALMQIATTMVETSRAIRPAMTSLSGGLRGVLRLAKMSGLTPPALDAAIKRFIAAHPLAEVFVTVLPWKAILAGIEEGSIDVGITYVQTVSAELSHLAVFEEKQMAYCGKNHALFGKTLADASLLAGYEFFVTDRDEPVELQNYRRRFGLGTLQRGGSEDVTELARLISASAVIGFLPEPVGQNFDNELWPLLSGTDLPCYQVYAVARPGPYQPPLAAGFLTELQQELI